MLNRRLSKQDFLSVLSIQSVPGWLYFRPVSKYEKEECIDLTLQSDTDSGMGNDGIKDV